MFSLDKIVISPLFLVKKMGKLVQEPAPKMLSPKIRGEGGERMKKEKKPHKCHFNSRTKCNSFIDNY